MAKLTAAQATEKHARRLKGATEDIRNGVDKVTVSPGVLAAAKQDKMRQKLIESIDSGKWGTAVKKVTVEDWRTKMTEKGIPRIAAGIDAAAGKVEAFFSDLLPFQDTLNKNIQKMPDLTLEDSISRMTAWTRGMATFKRK